MGADDTTEDAVEQRKAARLREMSDKLKAAGFDPGVPYYVIEAPDPNEIRVPVFKEALFESSYWEPKSVPLVHTAAEQIETSIPFVPELMEARYQPRILSQGQEDTFGCWDFPDWYTRGHLRRSGFGPQLPHFTVHLYIVLEANDAEEIQTIYVQLVAEPSGADPSTTLVESTGNIGLD